VGKIEATKSEKELLSEGCKIVAEALRKVVLDGEIPDWDNIVYG